MTIKKPHLLFIGVMLALWVMATPGCRATDSVDFTPGDGIEITLGGHRDVTPGKNFFYPESSICFTWESLVGLAKDSFKPVPVLAESWEVSGDGKRWTFHLRKGVSFHDGRRFDAEAVLANFDRYLKAPGKTRFYRFRMARFYPGFSGIEKTDDFTVVLTFKAPIPTLPYYMANWGSAMFSPACFDKTTGEFTTKPAGTGQYRVTEHVPDQYAVLDRFDAHWKNEAKSKRVRIKVIPDVNTRYSAMKSGEIHSTLDLGGITPGLAHELLKDPQFSLTTAKNSIVHFLALNGERYPFNDVRMRQAVTMIIDRSLISKAFYQGYFPPAANLLSYASPFYKEIPDPYDPEKAKQLARQVMGARKLSVSLLLPTDESNYPYKETAQYLQAVLPALGLRLTIRQVERGAFNDAVLAGDFHLYLRCQGLPHCEAMGIFNDYMRYSGRHGMNSETQNMRYHYNYQNSRAQALLYQVENTMDPEHRRSLYFELQDLAAETVPIVPLVFGANLIVYNKKLTGYNAMTYGVTLNSAQWTHGSHKE